MERRSAPVLTWLSSRSKLLLPLACLVLLVGGAAAPLPVAVPMLVLLLLVVGWLTYLSWPVLSRGGRTIRVATVALIALALASRLAS